MIAAQTKVFDEIATVLLENERLFSRSGLTREPVESYIQRVIDFFAKKPEYLVYITKRFAVSPRFENTIALELENRGVKKYIQSYNIDGKGKIQFLDRHSYIRVVYSVATIMFFLFGRSVFEKLNFELPSVSEFSVKLAKFLSTGFGKNQVSLSHTRELELDALCTIDVSQLEPEDRIFLAFATVLEKDGAAGLTVEHIAEELHMAKSSLYSYFKNKNELIMTLITKELQGLLNIVEEKQKYARDFYEKVYIQLQVSMSYFMLRPSVIPVCGWLRFRKKCVPEETSFKENELANADYISSEMMDIGLPVSNVMILRWFSTLPVTILIQGRAHGFTDSQLREGVKQVYRYIECGLGDTK